MEQARPIILIVDDEPANIEVLNATLGPDYEVLAATNGRDALKLATTERPALILLDVVMPGTDGYAVCRQLKADIRTSGIPVIFITAMDQENDEAKGLDAGAIDYITKPVRPAIVRARVRNHVELKRYRDLLESLSATDGLTGIANRRHFDERLAVEWRRARRMRMPLSLLMLDIDHFKAYNDHLGHLAGDECLQQIARTLAACMRRPADMIARYGGEEFACLLPDTDATGAQLLVEHMVAEVTRLNIVHRQSPTASHITVSIGAATLVPAKNQAGADIIRQADLMLYAAKEAGRNRVQSFTSPAPSA